MLSSAGLGKEWDNLGYRLPYISGPHQGHGVEYAFEDNDLDEIKFGDDKRFLRILLRRWAGMSKYHTVEVLSQVLRDMGSSAGDLLHFKTKDYDEQVK